VQAKVHCERIDAVAKEAVEYSLLGAWMPFADHQCFTDKKFKFFHPELALAEGEVTDWSKLTWFDSAHDSYKITGVKPDGKNFGVSVRFIIKGKPLDSTYIYQPDPQYTKTTGICGYVTNPSDTIVRIDCTDKKMTGSHIK
jgi:hypothetical protein